IRPKPFGDPGVVNIGARFCSGTAVFFPNQDPSSPGVCRLSDTKPFHSTFFQVLVGDISRIGVMETRCEGPQLCISRPQIHFPPLRVSLLPLSNSVPRPGKQKDQTSPFFYRLRSHKKSWNRQDQWPWPLCCLAGWAQRGSLRRNDRSSF